MKGGLVYGLHQYLYERIIFHRDNIIFYSDNMVTIST